MIDYQGFDMAGILYKPANAVRTIFSCLSGTVTRNPEVHGMPLSVSAELTNHCNLHCPECNSGSGMMTREKGFMDVGLYRRMITELHPFLYYINLYFQGEPMLHPDFFQFPLLAGNIYSIVSTNGMFLSPENSEKMVRSGLRKLIVSLDGMDQETYSGYRVGGNYSVVAEGIRNISEAIRRNRSRLKLEVQVLVNRYNEIQLKQAAKFASDVGASLKLKSMQVISSGNTREWMPRNKKFQRYRENEGSFIIKSTFPDRCTRLWLNPVITWDGKVIPCCFDKDARYVMGDLNKDSFFTIWRGRLFKEFRSRILHRREGTDICRNCTAGLKGVKY